MPSPSARPPANAPNLRGLRDRTFSALARAATRWPAVVIVLFAALAALAYLYIRDLPIRTSYLDLLPQHDPLVIQFQSVEREAAAADVIAVLFTLLSPPPEAAERERILFLAADRVLAELQGEGTPDLRAASYRVGEGVRVPSELLIFRTLSPADRERLQNIAREVQSLFPLPLPPRPFEDILRSVSADAGLDPAAIQAAIAELTAAGRAGLGFLAGLTAQAELLEEAAAISRDVLTRPPPEEIGEPILSQDRSRLVLQLWPTRRPFESLAYNQAVTRAVKEAVARAELDKLGVTAGLAGPYVMIVETDGVIRRDMTLVTIVSTAAVFTLVLVAFASPLLCWAAVAPVLVSALFTMAWAKFAVGGFNLLTVFLPALILGLGIDFSIHILSRFVEERGKGQQVTEALITAVRTKGSSCLTAALTTAVVFSCLLLSHSRALWEMGAISGVGILISFLTTLLLVPALVAVFARYRRSSRKRPIVSTTALRPAYRRFLRLRPGVVAVGLILTVTIVYQASRVQFRFVSDELAPATPATGVLAAIAREFAGEVWLGDSFRFFVEDPAEIVALETALTTQPWVHSTSSVRDFLPQELLGGEASILNLPVAEVQAGVAEVAGQLANWEGTVDGVRRLIARLAQLELLAVVEARLDLAVALSSGLNDLIALQGELAGVEVEEHRALLEAMSRDLATVSEFVRKIADLPPEPVLIENILALLPVEVRGQYYTKSGRYVVEARLTRSIREGDNLRRFLEWADTLGVERFGIPEVTARLEQYMRRDFILSTALAMLIIFLLVWRDFPRPLEAVLALAPLGMGYVWMLAGMNLLGIQFNFMNIVISPLLIGIGVDSAVHLLHRVKEEQARGKDGVEQGAAASAIPIVVSSLTTMASFGALLAAHTPGLKLLGTSALLGLGFTLLWSLTFLPAAFALVVEKGKPKE